MAGACRRHHGDFHKKPHPEPLERNRAASDPSVPGDTLPVGKLDFYQLARFPAKTVNRIVPFSGNRRLRERFSNRAESGNQSLSIQLDHPVQLICLYIP